MKIDPRTIWKEMNELIPLMREAVSKGLKKDFETFVHDDAHIQNELLFLNDALNFLQKKWTMDIIYIIRIKGKPFVFRHMLVCSSNLVQSFLWLSVKQIIG